MGAEGGPKLCAAQLQYIHPPSVPSFTCYYRVGDAKWYVPTEGSLGPKTMLASALHLETKHEEVP